MNIPHEPRIVQPKTNAVEQREVLLLSDTPKKEQIKKGPIIEDVDEDEDDNFEEPSPQNNAEYLTYQSESVLDVDAFFHPVEEPTQPFPQ